MKLTKWGASALRLIVAKIRLGKRLSLCLNGKPPYLGRGVRLCAKKGGRIRLDSSVYIDDHSRLQANEGGCLVVSEGVYMNTNCRIVAAERVDIGAHTMLGPNVCVFDHDHVFDAGGVHAELKSSPVVIGQRCWVAANALVTKGVTVADGTLVGGGSVVTRSLPKPGVYVGAPARPIRHTEGA